MTWRPTPHPPCPCKTCTGEPVAVPAYTPVQVVPEPTRTCGPVDPSGCRYCGIGSHSHYSQWSSVAGWHTHTPPTKEQRYERIRANVRDRKRGKAPNQ